MDVECTLYSILWSDQQLGVGQKASCQNGDTEFLRVCRECPKRAPVISKGGQEERQDFQIVAFRLISQG